MSAFGRLQPIDFRNDHADQSRNRPHDPAEGALAVLRPMCMALLIITYVPAISL
jgi:hypothetical protein